ncbi:putative involucrin repeat protein [Erysiphe neolycopersici]|uniref:Putative involucrin repeat protein n=1 Tax=Erysiphe neolycopersici TaxID=212602 RepID=A0A420HPN2_9PEZI|nr:putative involucrin repeat protein [Erysiphe neolycopersici]
MGPEIDVEIEHEKELVKALEKDVELIVEKDVEIELEKELEEELVKASEKDVEIGLKIEPVKDVKLVVEKDVEIEHDKEPEDELVKDNEIVLESEVEKDVEKELGTEEQIELEKEVDQNVLGKSHQDEQLEAPLALVSTSHKKKNKKKNQERLDSSHTAVLSTQVKNNDKISDVISNRSEPTVFGSTVDILVEEEYLDEVNDRTKDEKMNDELCHEKFLEEAKTVDEKKNNNVIVKEVDQKIIENSILDDITERSTIIDTKQSKKKKKKKNRKSLDTTMINNLPIQEDDQNVNYNSVSEILKPSIIQQSYHLEPLKELLNDDKTGKHVDKEDKRGPGKEHENNIEKVNKDEHPKQKENDIHHGIKETFSEDDITGTFVSQSTDPWREKKVGEIQKELDSALFKASSQILTEDDHVSDKYKFNTAMLKDKAEDERKPFDMIKEKPILDRKIEEDQKRLEAIIKTEIEVEPKVSETCQDKQVEDSLILVTTSGKKKKKKKKHPNSDPADVSSTLVRNSDKIPDDLSNAADYNILKTTAADAIVKVEQSVEFINQLKDEKNSEKEIQESREEIIKTEKEMGEQKENEKKVKQMVSETSQDKQLEDSSIIVTTSAKKKKKKKNQKRPDSGLTDASLTQALVGKEKNYAFDKIHESLGPELKTETSNAKFNVADSKTSLYDEGQMKDNAQSLILVDRNGDREDCENEVERENQKVDTKRNLGEVYITNLSQGGSWKECTGEQEKLGEENIQQMVLEKPCHENQLKSSATLVTDLDRKKKKDENQKNSNELIINESSIRVNIDIDKHKPLPGIAETLKPNSEVDGEIKDTFLSEKDRIVSVKGDKTNDQKSNKINVVPKVLEMPLRDNKLNHCPVSVTTSGKKNKKKDQKCYDSNLTDTLSIEVGTENKIHDTISEISESSMLELKQKAGANFKKFDGAIGSQNSVENNETIDKEDLEKEADPEVLETPPQSCQFENLNDEEKRNKNQKISGELMIDLPLIKVATEDKVHKILPKIFDHLTSETKIYEEAKQKLLNEEGVKEVKKDSREESKDLHKIEGSLKVVESYETKFEDKSEKETQFMVSEKAQQGDQNELSNMLKITSSVMKNSEENSSKASKTVIIETEINQNINKDKNCDDQLKTINPSIPKVVYHEKDPEEPWSGKDDAEEVKYMSLEISQQSAFTPSNALGETKIDKVVVDTTILSAVNEDEKHDDLSDAPTTLVPEVISYLNTKEWNLIDKEDFQNFSNEKGKKDGNGVVKELEKKDVLIASENLHEINQLERLSMLVTDSSKPEIMESLDPILSNSQLIRSSDRDKKNDALALSIESSISLPIYERDVLEKSFDDKAASEIFINNENEYSHSITNPDSSLDVLSTIPGTPMNNPSSFLADFTEIEKIGNVSKLASISKTDPCTEKELSENSLNEIKPREVIENIITISPEENHSADNSKPVKTVEKENQKKNNWKNLELSVLTANDLVKIEGNKSYMGKNDLSEARGTKINRTPKELLDNTQQDGSFSTSTNSKGVKSKTCQKTPCLAEDLRNDLLKSQSKSPISMFGIDNQDPYDNSVQSNLCNLNIPLKSKTQVFSELPISSLSKFLDSGSRSITSIPSKNDYLDVSNSTDKKSLLSIENIDQSTGQKIIKSFSDALADNHDSPLRSSRSSHFGFPKLPIVVEEKHLENVEQNNRLLYETEGNKNGLSRLNKDISHQGFQDVKSDSSKFPMINIQSNTKSPVTSKKDAYKGNINCSTISANEIPNPSDKFLLRNYRSFQMIPQEKPMDIRRSSSYSDNLSNKGLVQKRIEKFESSEEIHNPNKLEREIVETPLPQKSTREVYAGLKSYEPRARKHSKVDQGITTTVADFAIKGFPITLNLDIDQPTSDLKIVKSSLKVNNIPSQESQILNHETSSHSLRRSKPQTSGDLRSLSQHKEKLGPDKPNPPQDKQISNNTAPQPNEGRIRAKEMTEILDGVGEGHMTSPRSPTRPHSLRRRQSMKVMDLESKVESLVEQNRILAEEKQNVEQQIKSSIQISLATKDAELEALTRTLNFLQEEVSKLTEVNEGLNSAASAITQQYSDRNTILESEHAKLSQELEQIRSEYKRLTLNFQNEVQSKILVKDRKIVELRTELDVAKQKIREAQKQILLSKGCDLEYLSLKPEDYFENACQKLCQHVQQWVLRFSKYSDMKSCRLTGEIGDDKIVERLDNAILDGSNVDTYLSDRIKRRDVFMSVVMTMIWEYIFTRYLFGMGRDQRQKLKSLEKTLSEVGPASAVHSWRAITLTLLSKRVVFVQQKEQDTQAVVDVIISTLSEILPPPSNFERQIQEQLSRVMNEAVDLSVEMRCQKAEYMMLPPLQPEYDTNGEVLSKVLFNAAVMNERSGDTVSNKELEAQKAIVRIVLFPLVVKRGDDSGQTKQETVICPAQVLIAKPKGLFHRDDEVRSKISLKSNSHTMKSEYSSLGLPSVVE